MSLPVAPVRSKGFTYIELLLIVIVLGILAIGVSYSLRTNDVSIDMKARVLKNHLQLAQDLAMTQGGVFGFRSTDTTHYEIYSGSPGNPATDPLTRGNLVISISPAQFQGVVPSIEFLASGRPSIVADAQIVIVEGTLQKTITVKRNTGHITVQ